MTAMSVAPANASLIININGGPVEATVPTNTIAVFGGTFGVFNTVIEVAVGADNLADPSILDVTSLITSTGPGALSILVTETNLTVAGLLARFQTSFTGNFLNATVTRSLYLDTTNSGLLTTLLYSTSANNDSLTSALQGITGPFSISEQIDVTATGQALVSSDDLTAVVPEPGSFAVLLLGLLTLFGFAMARRRASA
jgi:hypothetical protein